MFLRINASINGLRVVKLSAVLANFLYSLPTLLLYCLDWHFHKPVSHQADASISIFHQTADVFAHIASEIFLSLQSLFAFFFSYKFLFCCCNKLKSAFSCFNCSKASFSFCALQVFYQMLFGLYIFVFSFIASPRYFRSLIAFLSTCSVHAHWRCIYL